MARTITLCILILAACTAAEMPTEPSENKGRAGQYYAKPDGLQYGYVVSVHKSYKPTKPAGLYVFIHGSGGGADRNGGPAATERDRYNLIGIFPKYDGEKFRDEALGPGPKLDTLIYAIKQIQLDYAIEDGRGIMESFSGGGRLMGTYVHEVGSRIGPDFPFSIMVNNESAVSHPPRNCDPRLAWLGYAHGGGWISMYTSAAAKTRFQAAEKGRGSMETYYVVAGNSHSRWKPLTHMAFTVLERHDTFYRALFDVETYKDEDLRDIATLANAGSCGDALKKLKRFKGDAGDIAEVIQSTVTKRIEALMPLIDSDPLLFHWYASWLKHSAKGMAEEKELKALIKKHKETITLHLKAFKEWTRVFPAVSDSYGSKALSVNQQAIDIFRSVIGRLKPQSLLAKQMQHMIDAAAGSE